MNSIPNTLKEKYENLKRAIKAKKRMVIAFSGGVDSALLATISKDVLGDSVWAVLVESETVPDSEKRAAVELAKDLKINFEIINMVQLNDDEFTRNDAQRCYLCRKKMAEKLKVFADEKNIDVIAAGAQASDLDDYRPGIRAFHEAEIWHPFIEFGFSKEEIRQLARYLGLPISNKPAMACLSSRIPYGHIITQEKLTIIEKAEEYLNELGFSQYRARVDSNTIRIEIQPEEFDKLMENRKDIINKMKALGLVYVSLDLEGFRSGSMNEVLEKNG